MNFIYTYTSLTLALLFLSRAEVLPFGSSVNSYGATSSDLDLCVAFDSTSHVMEEEEEDASSCSRLIFHAKGGTSANHHSQIQRYSDHLTNMLQFYLPGCQKVQHIRHARVPIIKYQQQLLGLNCDLSMGTL